VGSEARKKQREEYGCTEDEVVKADVSLNHGKYNIHLTLQPVSTQSSFTAKDWREAEGKWSPGAYNVVTALRDLIASDIVGSSVWKSC
jgi:hypothetical protein